MEKLEWIKEYLKGKETTFNEVEEFCKIQANIKEAGKIDCIKEESKLIYYLPNYNIQVEIQYSKIPKKITQIIVENVEIG